MNRRFLILTAFAPLVFACNIDPSNVGETAGETDAETETTGASGPGTAASSSGTSGSATSSGMTGPDEGSTGTPIPPVDCPDAEFSACATGTRGLVENYEEAVRALRERFEGGRTVLASELGIPGESSPATLAIALQAASGGLVLIQGDGNCGDALGGARSFWDTCHGPSADDGFGCEGRCTVAEPQIATCLVEGTFSCFPEGQCSGLCDGVCFNRPAGACEGFCVGTCEGDCDCVLDPSNGPGPVCAGTCEGACTGSCAPDEPAPCETSCIGRCLQDSAPDLSLCRPDWPVECVDGGAGTCVTDCFGTPTTPDASDTCCSDLVGFAGELSATCTPPTLKFGGPAACAMETPMDLDGVSVALGEVVVAQQRAIRLQEIVGPLLVAMQTPPAELDPSGCETEVWNADFDRLNAAMQSLSELSAEADALVDALRQP